MKWSYASGSEKRERTAEDKDKIEKLPKLIGWLLPTSNTKQNRASKSDDASFYRSTDNRVRLQ